MADDKVGKWVHFRYLRGACGACGAATHVAASRATGRFRWLHDDWGAAEACGRGHGKGAAGEVTLDELKEVCDAAMAALPKPGAAPGKKVRCVETGAVYGSISAAADAAGCRRTSLSAALRSGGTCCGLHWEAV